MMISLDNTRPIENWPATCAKGFDILAKLFVFSGAGLSAESGIQTFRNSPDGLWENHKIEQVCDYLTWKDNYDLVHQFYNARRTQLATVKPNAAHAMIAQWQARYPSTIMTQNVDDLLERAGCTDVVHLHGFLPEMVCEACGHVWHVGYAAWGDDHCCPNNARSMPCRSRTGVKPNVVFFHQDAPRYRDLFAAIQAIEADDVVIVCGTSEAVIPIGCYLVDRPGFKIWNSLEPSPSLTYDASVIAPATEAFVKIDRMLAQLLR
jgi:NAD-dependent deacetylase